MKILVVEDDCQTQRLLEKMAGSLGHDVTSFESPTEALEIFSKAPFPLVLLDWGLPEMDGLELCRNIRRLPGGDKSVIILITGREDPKNLTKILEAGVDDYIPKTKLGKGLLEIRIKIAEEKSRDRVRRKKAESRLKEIYTELEKKYDHMCSILNELKIGAVIIASDGRIVFLNKGGELMFGISLAKALGAHWRKILPLNQNEKDQVDKRLNKENSGLEKISFHFWNNKGKEFWVDFDIKKDPRDSNKAIFLFYDVSEVRNLQYQLSAHHRFHDLIGKSEVMMDLREQILNFSKLDWTIMIEGETGVGKELVARAIHFSGGKRNKPFIAVNAAGLSDSLLASQLFGHKRGSFTGALEDQTGLFESAGGGTLFLDEIGDISPNLQVSLLRVLEERTIVRLGENRPRKVDARFITATNRNLTEEISKGNFREDLLYRIRAARIHVAPLRRRYEDIPLLAEHFLSHARAATGKKVHDISPETMRLLMTYDWPGNVRELKSAINYSIIRSKGPVIKAEDLPGEITGLRENAETLGQTRSLAEMDIDEAIKAAGGNRAKAARMMGIGRATLYRRLSKKPVA